MKNFILITCLLQTALAAPQLISFKDGKVGVNFFGYHAQAGLGGGENGGLLGGLHASAGTPWGQNAAAGVGGNVNRRAAGVLYAGAQATPDIGAGAVLGGDTSRGGFSGSEAYANGKVASRTRTIVSENTLKRHENTEQHLHLQPVTENVNAIQKIRPPKKYYSSEADDFVNIDDYNGVAVYTNKTESIYDIKQETPAVAASVVIKKTINKTKLTTPFQSTGKHNNAPSSTAPIEQAINIDANDSNNYPFTSNEFNTAPSASSSLPETPSIIHSSSVSLSHSLNENNSNGNIARGVNNNDATAVIITRDRTKLRTHAHKHRRNHHPKRINLNRQRQRSKTIVKVVEQEEHPPATAHQQYLSAEELFSVETQKQQNNPQTYRQQQHPVRRQLIASPPHDLPARPCDHMKQECKNVQEEVRSDVVQSALQIPIGILQSLQQSFGNFGAH